MAVYHNNNGDLELIAGSTNYQFCPIGTILPFGGTSAPNGFFLCQGQALSRTEYKELFGVIGTSFGSGDGSTTFNIPDLRGEFLRGAGVNSHSGQGSGGAVGTHQNSTEIQGLIVETNTHRMVSGYNATGNTPCIDKWDSASLKNIAGATYYEKQADVEGAEFIQYMGVRPTNTSVNYIIKAKIVGGESDSEAIIGQKIFGTVVSNINIATGGATGNVMEITLPPGKWLVFSDGWIPVSCYLISSLSEIKLSEGTLSGQSQLGNASAYYQNSVSTTFYLQLVNWGETVITSFTGHQLYAVRIAL